MLYHTMTKLLILSVLTIMPTFSTPLRAQSKDGKFSKSSTQTVVVEGAGETADEAIKDAFRVAVRQVVGAFVDAETLLENDELIRDKVLTYSNGCIKKYSEIRKVEENGLFRVKIRADVERTQVIERLKAANVETKNIDGKSLFAEAITDLEREKDATALLKQAMNNFPINCLKVNAIGEPKLIDKDDATATISINVQIAADVEAYKTFAKHLQNILEKMVAKDQKGDFSITSERQSEGYYMSSGFMAYAHPVWMPKAYKSNESVGGFLHKDKFVIALCTRASSNLDKLSFRYYLLDNSLVGLFGESAKNETHQVRLMLKDTNNKVIKTDLFSLQPQRTTSNRYFAVNLISTTYGNGFDLFSSPEDAERIRRRWNDSGLVFFIAPTFFNRDNYILHNPKLDFERKIRLRLEELPSIQAVDLQIEAY